jgi:hypothetical protein
MALLAAGAAVVPAPGAAAAIVPAITIPQLAADVSACGVLQPGDVAAYAANLRDARAQTRRSQAVPNFANPAAVRELIRTTMPQFRLLGGSSHAMTAREYATYRAGELVAEGLNVSAAIGACRGLASSASFGNVSGAQVCSYPPCNVPHPVKTMYDTSGDYTNLYLNQETGSYVGEVGFNAKGAPAATGAIQPVSNTTWEPWVNGGKGGSTTFPAVTQTISLPNVTYTGNLPLPSSVPQSGWVVLPGSNIWADLGANTVMVPIDASGNYYFTVSGTANGGVQVVTYYAGSSLASATTYPATGTYLQPSLGALAIEIAGYLARQPGFFNNADNSGILQNTIDWLVSNPVTVPTILSDTSWSYQAGDLGGDDGGGGGGAGCAVSRPGAAVFASHRVAPLNASCGGDDW